jgi:hypothetical protein
MQAKDKRKLIKFSINENIFEVFTATTYLINENLLADL